MILMVLQNDVKYDVIDGTKRRQSETSLTIQNDVIDAKKRRQIMTSSKLGNDVTL